MKDYYYTKADDVAFSRGDWVWLYNPTRISPKLSRPWNGPYLVTEKVNDVIYHIQLSSRSKPKVVHRNPLCAYTGSLMEAWIVAEPVDTESSTPARYQPVREELCQERIVNVPKPQHKSEITTNTEMTKRRSKRRRKPPDRYGSNVEETSPETCEQEEGV